MNKIVLDDLSVRGNLFPFTHTRSAADIRIGILTIREKWEQFYQLETVDAGQVSSSSARVQSNIIPNKYLADCIRTGKIISAETLAAGQVSRVEYPWHIFELNDAEIRHDFDQLTANRKSQPLSETNQVIGPKAQIFLEPGAHVEFATLNASMGPVYIGKNAKIMEGSMIRGPFALCEGATVKMGAAIYGATTIGPFCIVGGEIKNSVFFGFSNKSHGGYLGDSVIGAWCNLGAGTSNSNLRNNLGTIKIWNESGSKQVDAGHKCGMFMGDYSRSAINTSFNSGTVVGICCNVFGNGLTAKNIPHFTWGQGERYRLDKALEDIRAWKKLKNHLLGDDEIRVLTHIFEQN